MILRLVPRRPATALTQLPPVSQKLPCPPTPGRQWLLRRHLLSLPLPLLPRSLYKTTTTPELAGYYYYFSSPFQLRPPFAFSLKAGGGGGFFLWLVPFFETVLGALVGSGGYEAGICRAELSR